MYLRVNAALLMLASWLDLATKCSMTEPTPKILQLTVQVLICSTAGTAFVPAL